MPFATVKDARTTHEPFLFLIEELLIKQPWVIKLHGQALV
jgi:hypothetical protein